jgi:hypothetical protein
VEKKVRVIYTSAFFLLRKEDTKRPSPRVWKHLERNNAPSRDLINEAHRTLGEMREIE